MLEPSHTGTRGLSIDFANISATPAFITRKSAKPRFRTREDSILAEPGGGQGGWLAVAQERSQHELPQHRDGLSKALCFERVEVLGHCFGWVLQTIAVILSGGDDATRR